MLHHQELNTTKKSKQMCFFFCTLFIHARTRKKVSIRNGYFMNADENGLNESNISCLLTCEGNGGHSYLIVWIIKVASSIF